MAICRIYLFSFLYSFLVVSYHALTTKLENNEPKYACILYPQLQIQQQLRCVNQDQTCPLWFLPYLFSICPLDWGQSKCSPGEMTSIFLLHTAKLQLQPVTLKHTQVVYSSPISLASGIPHPAPCGYTPDSHSWYLPIDILLTHALSVPISYLRLEMN